MVALLMECNMLPRINSHVKSNTTVTDELKVFPLPGGIQYFWELVGPN